VNAVIAHSGGPTAVLNASLVGAVLEARRHPAISGMFGARFGIEGLLTGDFVDLLAADSHVLTSAADATGSVIGTSRQAVGRGDLERVLGICHARSVRWLFYTGGNGSMQTAHDLAILARDTRAELSVIGIPKTIDNDLAGTDHAPGYGSAARFFASAARDIGADNQALPRQVQFLEVLGRHAGWIAAATALVRRDSNDAPHLIYLPERPLPLNRLLDDVQRVFDRLGRCMVVVCEGQLDDSGSAFGADTRISSRGLLATNLGHTLARRVSEGLGLKARAEKPGLFGRSAKALRSETDWHESRLCGAAAVRAAMTGASDVMVTLEREPGPIYASRTGLIPLASVSGIERLFPTDWIGPEGNSIQPAFLEYASPLAGPLEPGTEP
jgi:ATP-dependent phosphofructokinase / diphosphate-dependent phosphofructokinase